MTPLFLELPNVEAAIGLVLRNAGFRAYSSVPTNPVYPLLVVQRTGGRPIERHRVDDASIQIDSWGTNKSDARSTAEAARRAIHEAGESYIADFDCQLKGTDDELGLRFVPDSETKRDRYIFTVRVAAQNRPV